jgi:FAD/FMN-containing dehydrogenase
MRMAVGDPLLTIPQTLARSAVAPRDGRYAQMRHTYARAGAPALVLVPDDPSGVRDAVRFSAEHRLAPAIRSGGHGPSTNDGGVVIDLGRLRQVAVLDPARRIVRAGAGARWGEVAGALRPHGLALTSGDHGDVGVGGLATGGGIGLLARLQGLTIDRITAVDVVLADGTLLRVDETQHPDLLWAVRGAGGAFGAVTAFEFRAGRVADVVHAVLAYDATDLAGLLPRWAQLVEAAPRALTSFLYVSPSRAGGDPTARATIVYAGTDVDAARRAFAPFADVAAIVDQRRALMPYAALVTSSRTPHQAQASGLVARNGLLDHITADAADEIADLLRSGVGEVVQLRSVGGAVSDVARDATAFAHREQNFSLVVAASRQREEQLADAWAERLARFTRGTYLNLGTEYDDDTLREAFPPSTLARLRRLKERYDPTGVFDRNLPLAVAAENGGGAARR